MDFVKKAGAAAGLSGEQVDNYAKQADTAIDNLQKNQDKARQGIEKAAGAVGYDAASATKTFDSLMGSVDKGEKALGLDKNDAKPAEDQKQ